VAHQSRNARKSDSVCNRDWPLNRAKYAAANRTGSTTVMISPETAAHIDGFHTTHGALAIAVVKTSAGIRATAA
jgi:hypothetical protein